MLDVHILVHPNTPKDMVKECLMSVMDAKQAANYPVNVHVVPDAPVGHLGRARALGYAQGTYPWVTSVDDDDWVDRDAFALLADSFSQDAAAITTRCVWHQNGCSGIKDWRTNLRVFRRTLAQTAPLDQSPIFDALVMLHHADQHGRVIELPCAPYHYRLRINSNHRAIMASLPLDQRVRPEGCHTQTHLAGAVA